MTCVTTVSKSFDCNMMTWALRICVLIACARFDDMTFVVDCALNSKSQPASYSMCQNLKGAREAAPNHSVVVNTYIGLITDASLHRSETAVLFGTGLIELKQSDVRIEHWTKCNQSCRPLVHVYHLITR